MWDIIRFDPVTTVNFAGFGTNFVKYYKMLQNLLDVVCNGNPIPAECLPTLFKLNGNHCEYAGYHLF